MAKNCPSLPKKVTIRNQKGNTKMRLLNIAPPDAAPTLINPDFILSISLWHTPDGKLAGTSIRMAAVASRDESSAPVRHVTALPLGVVIAKLRAFPDFQLEA
jgi:hypothetical protein